jgi:thioredoxin reductase (NADPH)
VDVIFVAARRPEQLRGSIRFVAGRLNAVEGGGTVERVILPNETLDCEGVFILRSAIAPGRLLEGLEVRDGAVAVDRQMATSVPGVFAAGDCTGEPLQVSKAMGEGQIAGLSAAAWCVHTDSSPLTGYPGWRRHRLRFQ